MDYQLLLELFITFFLLGAFTFGGGLAMLPLVQAEVIRHKWLVNEEIINFIAISQSTPGPFAINMSTYVGVRTHGIIGAISATLGVVLPSFIIIIIIAILFEEFSNNKVVKYVMSGLKPAVIGLIANSFYLVAKEVLLTKENDIDITSPVFYLTFFIFLLMVFLDFVKKISPIIIVLFSAILGIIFGFTFNL